MSIAHRRLLPFCFGGLTLPAPGFRDGVGLLALGGLVAGWAFGRFEERESEPTGDGSSLGAGPSVALG